MVRDSITAYREKARDMYEDEGTIEFDPEPDVSLASDGAYVQAWIWIPRESLEDE